MKKRSLFSALLVAFMTFAGAGAAQAATSQDLIAVNPGKVSVVVPAPGHSAEWSMRVTNVSTGAVPLGLKVTAKGDTNLMEGTRALTFTGTDADGEVVIAEQSVGAVDGRTLELPYLQAGQSYTLNGVVELPQDATNDVQGASGELVFAYTAMVDDAEGPVPPKPIDKSNPEKPEFDAPHAQPKGPPLASTGWNMGGLVVVAAILVLVGWLSMRTRSTQR